MNGTVLDILIYVFDRYMLAETPDVPEREELAMDLERAGFEPPHVEAALDWLADLAGERDRPAIETSDGTRSMRVYTESELNRISAECRGYLLSLERAGILCVLQREIVIDRLLALEADEVNLDQLKWIVLMVLSSQPGAESACSRMEGIVFDLPQSPH